MLSLLEFATPQGSLAISRGVMKLWKFLKITLKSFQLKKIYIFGIEIFQSGERDKGGCLELKQTNKQKKEICWYGYLYSILCWFPMNAKLYSVPTDSWQLNQMQNSSHILKWINTPYFQAILNYLINRVLVMAESPNDCFSLIWDYFCT